LAIDVSAMCLPSRNECAMSITIIIDNSIHLFLHHGYVYSLKGYREYFTPEKAFNDVLFGNIENKIQSLETQLKEKTEKVEALESKLEVAKEATKEAAKKAKGDEEKSRSNLLMYMYLLIALAVILGISNLYLLSKKKILVEDQYSSEFDPEDKKINPTKSKDTDPKLNDNTEKEPTSCNSDEKTHSTSTPQHYSKDCAPILVRDSYYEEHGADSQATVTISEEEKIQSSESVYSTQTINEEEKEEPTKEISTKKRKQIKIQTSKKQIKIKTPKKKVSHSHEIIKK